MKEHLQNARLLLDEGFGGEESKEIRIEPGEMSHMIGAQRKTFPIEELAEKRIQLIGRGSEIMKGRIVTSFVMTIPFRHAGNSVIVAGECIAKHCASTGHTGDFDRVILCSEERNERWCLSLSFDRHTYNVTDDGNTVVIAEEDFAFGLNTFVDR